jgi:hypothetical protein
MEGFEDSDDLPITEETFEKIQTSLKRLYSEPGTPKEVRRRILEASVRAPEAWHDAAIREAYGNQDPEWMLTAVFAMGYVPGFDDEILATLKNPDPEIHLEAVKAAGNRELEGAWTHVVELVENKRTPKDLLLAAIAAVGVIRPGEAGQVLVELTDSKDEDIAEAANEAISMASVFGEDGDEDEGDKGGDWIN